MGLDVPCLHVPFSLSLLLLITSTHLPPSPFFFPFPQENAIDYKIPTAVATSLTNIVAIAYKDREFARMQSKSPASFPKTSYLLMGMRDCLTVTSTFVLKVGRC